MKTQATARLKVEALAPARRTELLPWHQNALTLLKPYLTGYEYISATPDALKIEADYVQLTPQSYAKIAQQKLFLTMRVLSGMVNVIVTLKEWD